jgi:hypothetical protein
LLPQEQWSFALSTNIFHQAQGQQNHGLPLNVKTMASTGGLDFNIIATSMSARTMLLGMSTSFSKCQPHQALTEGMNARQPTRYAFWWEWRRT